MNELNFASLRASKKLVDNGIVLETDQKWYLLKNEDWYLSGESIPMIPIIKELPAPSFAEIWRELPSGTRVINRGIKTQVYINYADKDDIFNTNPADAIAEFLIWVKGQEEV